MPYVTSFERIAEKKGVKIGVEIGEKRGVEIGEKRGVKRGENTAMIKTARMMLSDGLAVDVISKYTGLSLEEIKKLTAPERNN